MKANPGLSSRFDKTLQFHDYTPAQLELIAIKMLEDEGYKIIPKAIAKLSQSLTELYTKRDKYFGNARTVRKVILDVIKNQNLRFSAIPSDERKKSQFHVIQPEDINNLSTVGDGELMPKKTIGFRSTDV